MRAGPGRCSRAACQRDAETGCPGRVSPAVGFAQRLVVCMAVITVLRGIHLTGLCQVGGSPGPGRPRALDAQRMAPLAGHLGWLGPGLRVSDQIAVPHRIVADGELEHAVEDQAPAAGPAPVEAEAELDR
jgi:hypothetical protein